MSTTAADPIRYVKSSAKSVSQAQQDLEAAIAARKFSVLHVYDLKSKLNEKGFELAPEVRVLELCNAAQAEKVLKDDITMNMALPCRISVWQEGGTTRIGMLRPKALLSMLSSSPVLAKIAAEVETAMVAMVDAAC